MASLDTTAQHSHALRAGGRVTPLRPSRSLGLPGLGREDIVREVQRRDAIFRRSLVAADAIAAALAIAVCAIASAELSLRPLAALALILIVAASKAQGAYDRDELLINKTTLDQVPQLFQSATLHALLFFLLQGTFVEGHVGPPQVLVLWGSLLGFSVVARHGARALAYRVTAAERCLFVGTGDACDRLRSKLASNGGRAVVVGRMTLTDEEQAMEAAEHLRMLIREQRIHRVVIEPGDPIGQATLDFVREAKASGTRVSLLPRVLEVVGSAIEVDDIDGLTLLGVRRFGLSRSAALTKRGLDLAGSTLGLIAVAPLLAAIALLIKLDSRGPAIYRQIRVGRDGRPFEIWKFRTMIDGADALKPALLALNEADGLFKIAGDPRVTRIGRGLRRYSLDELPQLVNVLRGEMSLVGPRPLVIDDDARITGLDRRRLHLTPGMTGHWQILGSSRIPLPEMTKLDYLYVAGWSLWSDVKILLRTVPYVLARRGM